MSDDREQSRREKALAWMRDPAGVYSEQELADGVWAREVAPEGSGMWREYVAYLAGHRAASKEKDAEIAALQEAVDQCRFVMMEARSSLHSEGRRPESNYAMSQLDNGIKYASRALEEKP